MTLLPDQSDSAAQGMPQSIAIALNRPFIHQDALAAARLRVGMWVVTQDGAVGILTGCGIDAMGEVTFAKPDGTTLMMLDQNDKPVPVVVRSQLADLRQATIEDIPAPRRPDEAVLISLGYQHGGAA
ncbi:hypothetical protein SAMN06265795_12257 [Noviherbaspirillum humi]|uniref:Uncharacterized protein n=1 Tax=Noviherbaspirillum humi TaxID=1688639 RepID=A0A239LHQ1_9BURK|nr:hypothetical protein [Noviherbaspirillum humi]SNT29189.1 hypothetical protein SAMN06265795_12257 [Noviherbaspirillum humi]